LYHQHRLNANKSNSKSRRLRQSEGYNKTANMQRFPFIWSVFIHTQ